MNLNGQPSLKKISRRKLVDQVLQILQDTYLTGQYNIGDKLPPEPDLMNQMGVGRSTIREAVKILVHAGSLEVRQGDGTYICSLNPGQDELTEHFKEANASNIYEVRNILEVEMAGLAAERRTADDLKNIKKLLNERNQLLKNGQYVDYVNADIAFHVAICHASRNEVLEDLYTAFSVTLRPYLTNLVVEEKDYDDHTAVHETLFQAIASQDVGKAKDCVRENLLLLRNKNV